MLALILAPLHLSAERSEENHKECGTRGEKRRNPWLCNLGPTGARAILKTNTFVVKEVWENGPAEKAGLKIDDVILGVNGKPFSEYVFSTRDAAADRKGYEGPVMDLGNAIEDSEGADGKLIFSVFK